MKISKRQLRRKYRHYITSTLYDMFYYESLVDKAKDKIAPVTSGQAAKLARE